MLDSISPPSIPRRPKKPSQIDFPNDLEGFDKSDTESDNEQKVSLESLKSNEASDKIPVIPKRPDRSKSSSKSPSLPSIPKRPQKSVSSGVEASSSPDLPEVVNEEENYKSTNDGSITSKKHANDAIELNSGLVSEVDDASDVDVSDGDKIPDNMNTKTTIKEDLSIADDNSMHDDFETVLQDRDYSDSSAIVPEISHINNLPTSNEVDINTKLDEKYTDPDSNSQKACENRDNENVESSADRSEGIPTERDIQSNDSEESQKAIAEGQKISNTPKVTDEPTSDDKDSDNIPHIPRRPKKSKFALGEPITKSNEGEDLNNINVIDPRQTQVDNEDNREIASSINDTSQSKAEKAQPEKSTAKPKAPPKPKKLSSKIAAFQQMFNQETTQPRNTETSKSISKPDLEAKTSENKEVPSRLSTDKMKFAQSLQGMMDKGIAMPGMVNPNFHQKIETEDAESTDKEMKILNVKKGIAKGPRGKKLPKSLKNPINVEVAPRFNSFVLTIWELDFQAETKSNDKDGENASDKTEAERLENNAEILDLENKSEYVIDNYTPASNIREESSPLNIDHDAACREIDKLKITQCELKNFESIGSTGGSRVIDAENLPEKIGCDNDSDALSPNKLDGLDLSLDENEQNPLKKQELDLNPRKEH